MQFDIFNAIRDESLQHGVLFYYTGFLSNNVIAAMGDTLRSALDAQGSKGSTTRKVFSTFIELAQNVLNYAEDTKANADGSILSRGAVTIGVVGEHYFIICGNDIDNAHATKVSEKIEAIRTMSPDEIKRAYKQQLRKPSAEHDIESKGAGLGLLTVARDASAPIEYCLVDDHDSPEGKVSFYLKALI